jgi:hypothetical protein
MDQFIEVTLKGYDALCVDPDQGFFQPGAPGSYTILTKVPASWIGTNGLPNRLFTVAECVNTDQSNALLAQGSMVGHFLVKFIDYRILGDHPPDVIGPCRCPACCTGEQRQEWLRSWPISSGPIISGGGAGMPYYAYLLVRDDGSYQSQSPQDYYLVGEDGRLTERQGRRPNKPL